MGRVGWLVLAIGLALSLATGQDPAVPADLGAAVQKIFESRCAECHASTAKKVRGEFGIIDKLTELVKDPKEYVVSGEPEKSRIWIMVNGNDAHSVEPGMPQNKDGDYVPLPADEKLLIRRWIEGGAPAPGEKKQPAVTRPKFVSNEEILDLIARNLANKGPPERQSTRYFTLVHLYNSGAASATLERYRHAVVKLVNSLSWAPTIHRPMVFGPGGTIVGIDLRLLKWDAAKWERILDQTPGYGILTGGDREGEIARATGTGLAYVRGDWFVFHASRPPLYHDLLAPCDDPHAIATAPALEEYLKIDVASNIVNCCVARAGFDGGKLPGGSGVSDNNRVIERHEILRWRGAYWKSYDFGSNAEAKNIKRRPLGPKGLPGLDPRLAELAFEHDGGEVLWNLPNGLQAYLLVDAAGKRLNEAPPSIVRDNEQHGGKGTAIVNGISCMPCHVRGIREKDDQIREHMARLVENEFPPFVAEVVGKLYPERAQMSAHLVADGKLYLAALERAGVGAGLDGRGREQVAELASAFDDTPLTQERAAYELGFEPADFKDAIAKLPSIRRQLAGAGLQRSQFSRVLSELVERLKLGELFPGPLHPSPTPIPGKEPLIVNLGGGITMKFLHIPAAEFEMGSVRGEHDEVPVHRRRVSSFLLAETEVTQEQWKSLMGSDPSMIKGAKRPVEQVSWQECQEFIEKLNASVEGGGFRLPSEAEWEYACRAGSPDDYCFGNDVTGLGEFANFRESSGNTSHPVRDRKPNQFGLYDMHGNVWEWCQDVYHDSYVGAPKDGKAWEVPGGPCRVIRGGGWHCLASDAQSANRDRGLPDHSSEDLGFRLAKSVAP